MSAPATGDFDVVLESMAGRPPADVVAVEAFPFLRGAPPPRPVITARQWIGTWAGAAAFGTVPLALGEFDVEVTFWAVEVLALVFTWAVMRNLRRGRLGINMTSAEMGD